jgi:dolichol-phosphate mannosyltransferase
MSRPRLSVVVPFFDEQDNVRAVLDELHQAVPDAEIVAVDDGSNDGTWARIGALPYVRGIRLTENCGQSAALYVGIMAATGELCVTMDGDGQNDPHDIPRLLAAREQGQGQVICGYRARRRDSLSRRLASRSANFIRHLFIDDDVRDTGCGLKLFPTEYRSLLVPFNGLHRFLPALFKQAGLRVAEVPVNHRPRTRGRSKYSNWERALRGACDLIGVAWLLKRRLVLPPLEKTP